MSIESLPEVSISEYKELNPEGAHTILLVGGATEGVATQNAFAEALAEEGYRVVSFDYTREIGLNSQINDHYAGKAEQTSRILEQVTRDDERVTLFGHSMGAGLAIGAAVAHPDYVDRIILANPSGLFDDTRTRLAGRFATETVRKTLTMKKEAQVQQVEGAKYIARRPLEFWKDAQSIADEDIRDELAYLKDAGIKVNIMLSRRDQVYPWRLQEDYFEGQKPEEFDFESVSSYFNTKPNGKQHKLASKWAGHDQNIIYPEQTAQLIKQIVG